ncbi:DUF86 domain-containing protein [Pseudoneobacillus sp. C159]
MYFVDREKIEHTLVYFENQLALFQSHKQWSSPIEIAALERVTHMMIEAILDVGNSMIDGFIMRDPGSYEDIVDILIDEKVVTSEMGVSLKEVISLRKNLIQHYLEVNHKTIEKTVNQNMEALKNFSEKVREYIQKELGPVSAFKN